ncbi:MAG: D-glycero-beta-D-manno-heptose-7-phosphate kinase [Thermodesulfobacteriota bacterium]
MLRYMTIERARELIKAFPTVRVFVIGDLIMDHFLWGKVRRISPEAPVPVVEVEREDLMLGGAANVAHNISRLGGGVSITGVIGKDDDGRKFLRALKKKSIPQTGIIVDPERPTTTKTRIIAHNQQVVRYDREKKNGLKSAVTKDVLSYIKEAVTEAHVVVVSDYAKGLISEGLMKKIVSLSAKKKKPLVVDPKVEHLDYYRGADIITPNNLEAGRGAGLEIKDARTLKKVGKRLKERLSSRALLITRGEHGMSLFENDSETHIPTVAKEVYDVSGAGDTVVGVLALALAAGADFKEAAVLANFAAGVVVGKLGTATLTGQELFRAVTTAHERSGRLSSQ